MQYFLNQYFYTMLDASWQKIWLLKTNASIIIVRFMGSLSLLLCIGLQLSPWSIAPEGVEGDNIDPFRNMMCIMMVSQLVTTALKSAYWKYVGQLATHGDRVASESDSLSSSTPFWIKLEERCAMSKAGRGRKKNIFHKKS